MDGSNRNSGMIPTGSEAVRRETFLRLISEYRAPPQRLAAAYVRDTRDREDLVQEIAVAFWQAIPRFRGESSERTWLYRIAHNTAITAVTRLRRRGRSEAVVDNLPEPKTQGSTHVHEDDGLIRAQRREWLIEAIRQLPAADRQIVTLHLEELSHREIQEIAGMSEGAIATRLSRIRDRLAAQINDPEVKPL